MTGPPGRALRGGLAVTAAAVLVTLTVIAAVVALTASRSAAAPTRPDVALPGDGVDATAHALLASPLYVHPDMAWLIAPGEEKKIQDALHASPVRVYLAVVPLNTDDDDALAASYFLDQLYRQLHRPGVYLAVGPSGNIYDAEYLVPREIELPASVEQESVFLSPGPIASNTPGRILTVLHLIATATADPQQAVSPTPWYTPSAPSGAASASDSPSAAAQLATAGIASFLFAGPLLAVAGSGLVAGVRRTAADRRGWGDAGDPGLPAGRMPSLPSASWLRRHAQGELAALGRLIAAGNDTNPGWSRACDDYDAGMLALTPTAEPIDLAGAIVLAREGRLALAWQTAAPPPPCLVNPLHGRSVRVLPGAGHAGRPFAVLFGHQPAGHVVPVCAGCARVAGRVRPPRLGDLGARLLKVEHLGQRVPYSAFRNLWWDVWSGSSGRSLPQAVREHLGVS